MGLDNNRGRIVSLNKLGFHSMVPEMNCILGSIVSNAVSGVFEMISFNDDVSSSVKVETEALSSPRDSICWIFLALSLANGVIDEDRDMGAGDGGTDKPP
jgi:hypothetical protein